MDYCVEHFARLYQIFRLVKEEDGSFRPRTQAEVTSFVERLLGDELGLICTGVRDENVRQFMVYYAYLIKP